MWGAIPPSSPSVEGCPSLRRARRMGLKLNLRANERLVVNGALLTALKPTSLLINNQVSMLLERHIMRPEHASTPARRIYFAIQCAYIADAAARQPYLDPSDSFIQ